MEKNETISHCALGRVFGFKPRIGLSLIKSLGSASAVFSLSAEELDAVLGPYSPFGKKINRRTWDEAAEELEKLKRKDVKFVCWSDEVYPEVLKECDDSPIGLYVRTTTGLTELWKKRRRIAVIGTRDISPYGREWCRRIVEGLSCAKEKPVIVSGLALGTDFIAHKTALECGLPTIGVMATGADSIYPSRHNDFAERLYHSPDCALITDYPSGTSPLPVHFLRRNRIIAGLSDSSIIVESKIKGGGMMTCGLAFQYGRDVYALPGRADDLRSQGCNHLIKSKMAEPLTSIKDLLDDLDLKKSRGSVKEPYDDILMQVYGKKLNGEDLGLIHRIISLIKVERGISIDEISNALAVPYSRTASLVSLLETDQFISLDILQRCSINYRR